MGCRFSNAEHFHTPYKLLLVFLPTMSFHNEFVVHFAQRGRADDRQTDFNIAFIALIVADQKALAVYEREDVLDARAHGAVVEPALQILFSDITVFKAKGRIRSEHSNHVGSMIRIYGTFDRGYQERITLKMGTDVYDRLMAFLEPFEDISKKMIHL